VNTRTFDEVLASRRMCRDFEDAPVDDSILEPVLRAAFRAPSAGNTVALDLVVLRGSDVGRYWDITLPDTGPHGARAVFRWPGLLRAPVLVVPVVEPGAYVARYAEADKAASGLGASADDWPVPYWWVDAGAAMMGLLLAAEECGLGALLFGQFGHEPAVSAAFGVPADRRAAGTVALGWPAPGGRARSASARRGRPDPDGRIHPGRW
jgi:nitroreductase